MKNNYRHNAFTFIELLMVMLVLGIIITLTMPLLQNIKNDEDMYRAYMKKALHDVTDATSLVLLRERYLTDFTGNSLDKLCSIYGCSSAGQKYQGCAGNCSSNIGLRTVYNLLALPGTTCRGSSCFSGTTAMPTDAADLPGIKIGNKTVMQFYYFDTHTADNPPVFGEIYIDVNGNHRPNKMCDDRYKFNLLQDRVVLTGCNLEL